MRFRGNVTANALPINIHLKAEHPASAYACLKAIIFLFYYHCSTSRFLTMKNKNKWPALIFGLHLYIWHACNTARDTPSSGSAVLHTVLIYFKKANFTMQLAAYMFFTARFKGIDRAMQ